jgi:hypothetical protein
MEKLPGYGSLAMQEAEERRDIFPFVVVDKLG